MQRLFDFYNACYNYRWKLKRHHKSGLHFWSVMDVIASVKSLYQVRIIDVAIFCENAHLKHFVFGDTTGPAKVSHVHCLCRPGLPVLVS